MTTYTILDALSNGGRFEFNRANMDRLHISISDTNRNHRMIQLGILKHIEWFENDSFYFSAVFGLMETDIIEPIHNFAIVDYFNISNCFTPDRMHRLIEICIEKHENNEDVPTVIHSPYSRMIITSKIEQFYDYIYEELEKL